MCHCRVVPGGDGSADMVDSSWTENGPGNTVLAIELSATCFEGGTMTRLHLPSSAGLVLLLLAAPALADTQVLKKTTTGTPTVAAIDAIRFGPGGVLFIGDGRGGQVLAVETGGVAARAGFREA